MIAQPQSRSSQNSNGRSNDRAATFPQLPKQQRSYIID